MTVKSKTRPWQGCSGKLRVLEVEPKIQSLRDKHRCREGQIEKLRSRNNALQQTLKDMQKGLQDAQEELQGRAQTVVDIEKEMQGFKDEIMRLENTNEGRGASDAGSVHQGRVREEQQQAFLESLKICGAEVGNLQEWSARFSAEVENRRTNQKQQEDSTGPAAAKGANQVPSLVTPSDWQGKQLSGDRLPVQSLFPNARSRSRSPVLGVRSGGRTEQ